MLWLLIASALAMTSDQAVEAALDRTPVLELAEARVLAAQARAVQARGALLPTVSATAMVSAQTELDVMFTDMLPDIPLIDPDEVDPRARTIEALVAEVQSLRARLNDMEDRLSPTQLHDEAGKGAIPEEDSLGVNPRKS